MISYKVNGRHGYAEPAGAVSSRGFALFELMILFCLTTLATAWMIQSSLSAKLVRQDAEARHRASVVLERGVALLRVLSPNEVWSTLGPPQGDANGEMESGRLLSLRMGLSDPTLELGVRIMIDETEQAPLAGLPRDLDQDGLVQATDVSADTDGDGEIDAVQLPVLLSAVWTDARGGAQSLSMPVTVIRE